MKNDGFGVFPYEEGLFSVMRVDGTEKGAALNCIGNNNTMSVRSDGERNRGLAVPMTG